MISDADDTGNPPTETAEVFVGLYADEGFQDQLDGFYFPKLADARAFSTAVAKAWKETKSPPAKICDALLSLYHGKNK